MFIFEMQFRATLNIDTHLAKPWLPIQHTYTSFGRYCLLLPILHLHVHDEQHFQTSWCKENIMVQPNKALAKRGVLTNMLSFFMPSCIQNQSLGFLGLSPIFGTYSSLYKLFLDSTMAATYAQVSPPNKTHRIMLKCH